MFSTNTNKYKLFNENNLDFMKRLPDSSIDLILTDPPYNLAPFSRGNIHLNNGKTIHNNIAEWDNVPLQPEDFELETNTVWAFPDRGKWATHDA